jgi:Na+-transporting NADH:ubiquinone oxidoreductase subunit NqrC
MMRRVLALVAAVLLVTASASFAQQQKKKKGEDTTRSVAGVVNAVDDSPIIGAVVQLKNTKTLQIRSFITKENGAYYFHELSPDVDYELKADYQGSSSPTKTLSSFDSRKSATINLKLNPKK